VAPSFPWFGPTYTTPCGLLCLTTIASACLMPGDRSCVALFRASIVMSFSKSCVLRSMLAKLKLLCTVPYPCLVTCSACIACIPTAGCVPQGCVVFRPMHALSWFAAAHQNTVLCWLAVSASHAFCWLVHSLHLNAFQALIACDLTAAAPLQALAEAFMQLHRPYVAGCHPHIEGWSCRCLQLFVAQSAALICCTASSCCTQSIKLITC
jgi:hypothetical protein